MCWKQEWAMAINNLNWAIIHVQRAQVKVRKRQLTAADVQSTDIVQRLRQTQEELKRMIDSYGIKRTPNPARVQELMTGKRTVKGV